MPEPSQTRVGEQLRRIRESAGLSGSAVARELGWSQSKVSRVETGRFGASLEEVAQLLNYYAVPEEVRAEILAAVARHEGMEGAWVVRAGGSSRRQGEVATVESRVRALSQYQALWFPGLLQSPDYAAAIAKSGGFGPEGTFVERRAQRQQTLRERKDVTYTVILEEQALTLAPGAASVMAQQLEHVLEAIDTRFVDLRIRPTDRTNAVFTAGSFVIYDFASGPSVVLTEGQTADLYLSAEADLTAYRELFTKLHKNALGRKESRAAVESARRRVAS
jgi:transcriptional regulator with XRE-family HTH domain